MRDKKYKYALCDLSGTVHVGSSPIPGARAALSLLKSCNVNIRYLTNTSKTSRGRLLEQLRGIGFDEACIGEEEVITSVIAARNHLMDKNLKAFCLTEDIVMEDLSAVDGGDMSDLAGRGAVLVGLAPSKLGYDKMNDAFRVLMKEETELVAIHKSKYFRDGDGSLSLGPGPFVSALEEATGKKAHVVGKPSSSFYSAALEELGCEPGECVMVGDDIVGDIKGAKEVGMDTILVRTGKFLKKDEENKKIVPTLIADSIVEAVEWIVGEEYDTDNEDTILKEMGITGDDGEEGGEDEPPMSPREEKMVKEIQSLRNQLKQMGGGEGSSEPKVLFQDRTEEKTGEEKGEESVEDKGSEEKGASDDPTPQATVEVETPRAEKKEKRKIKRAANATDEELEMLRKRIVNFYTFYANDENSEEKLKEKARMKLSDGVEDVMKKKIGKEKELFEALVKVYGPEPPME